MVRCHTERFHVMKINIKLMGMLKEKTPPDGILELSDTATISDALAQLGIAADAVQVCTVNGTLERDLQRQLAADDELSVVPPVGGG